jgi:hypothetical protein
MNEQQIQALIGILRSSECEVTYEVKKKPKGVHITIEVTQEEMDALMHGIRENKGE